MPITVVCEQCGKAYAADERIAGRRVRCRGCGHIVTVPRNEAAAGDDGPNLDSLAQVERSFAAADAMSTRVGGHAAESLDPAMPQLPTGAEDVPLSGEGIEHAGRANLRFNFAGAKELDLALPWILLVGSVLWLLMQAGRSAPPGSGWVTLTSSLAWMAVYAGIVWPSVFAAVRAAGRKVGFQLPRTSRWRTFAAYLPAFALTATMWMMDMGPLRSMLIGSIGGLLLASCFLYVLFRLMPEEVPATAAFGAGGYVLGLLVACAALFGANHLAKSIVESTNSASTLSTSPFGSGFAWAKDEQRIAETTNRDPRERNRIFLPDRARQENTPVVPEPVVSRSPPLTPALVENAAGAAWAAVMSSLPIGPVVDAGPQVVAPASRLVAGFTIALDLRQPADRFVFPITASPFIATLRQQGEMVNVQVWDSKTWKPLNPEPIAFRAAHGLDDYALSADGTIVARTSTFLDRAIESYAVTAPTRPPQTTPLPSGSMHGLLPRDQALIKEQAGARLKLDIVSLDGRTSRGFLEIPAPEGGDRCLEIVGDTRFVAALNRDERGNTAVRCYALGSDRNVASKEIPIAPPTSDWPATPAGVAVSTDAPRLEDNSVAVLFERDGGAVIFSYDLGTGRRSGEYIDRTARLSRRLIGYVGPAVRWIGSGKSRHVLVYGRTVVNVATGQVVEDIDLSGVIDFAIVDPKTLIYLCNSDRHTVPVRVQLNLP